MPLIYITGAPGAGKSTTQEQLQSLGFIAYDIDNRRFGGPYNLASGLPVVIPPASEREDDWFNRHEWRINTAAIEALKVEADQNPEKPIFLCGVAPSDEEILPIFDKIIYLSLSDAQLTERLDRNGHNDYGNNESEKQQILERKAKLDARYKRLGVLTIDATMPKEAVAQSIVDSTHIKT